MEAQHEAELLSLEERDAIERARSSILDFTLYTKPDYDLNWHHRLLCETLDRFARGEIQRLIIEMPPRHGKSELVSRRLPAFLFGINPDVQIISASYGADLASRMNRDVQRIMDSPEYHAIFPESSLNAENVRTVAHGNALRNSDLFEIGGFKGVYRSAGVGGAITGMGANVAIIDDPIKNQEEADSTVYRERVWEWYTSTLYTRLENPGQVLLTMTRWHEDDLAGRLLAAAKKDPEADQWEVLSLPAIKDHDKNPLDTRSMGEALWPAKYDLKRLVKMMKSLGSRVWNALYQQRPSAATGNIIKRGWIRWYDAMPTNLDEIIITVDATFTAKAKSDYVAMEVWGRAKADKYFIDLVYKQMGITETITELLKLCAKHPRASLKLIENKANGPAIEDLLRSSVSGIVLWEPRGDKVARANAVAPQFESGNIYFPRGQPWAEEAAEEAFTFPNSTHDDRTDAMTMALIRLGESESHEVGTIRIVRTR